MARTAIFFLAYVVMMFATFGDARALLPTEVNPLILYVPAGLVAAALMAHARIPPRLPEAWGWYIALAILAVAQFLHPFLGVVLFAADFVALPYLAVVKPLLMLAIAFTLLRVKPRIGDLYLSGLVPGFTVFLALTALVHQSVALVKDFAAAGVTHPAIERIPAPMANVAAAAIVAVLFVMFSGIRHRSMQLNPSKGWLVTGIGIWLVSAASMHFPVARPYGMYGLVAAHVMLLVGMTYLLSHLLPSREADQLA